MIFQSINPATEELLDQFAEYEPDRVERALSASERTFGGWRTTSFKERGDLLRSVAKELRGGKQALAGLITAEMGKPIVEAEAEIEKCAWCCDYFADHAEQFLANRPTASAAMESYVRFEPLGGVLAIMPWNFPFWQVFRFAAPALMAGNTAVLKHASNVPLCALMIEEMFRKAGFPRDRSEERRVGKECRL